MDKVKRDELRKLAESASQTEWVVDTGESDACTNGTHIMTIDGYAVAGTWAESSSIGEKHADNGRYIAAACPETILSLLSQIDALEAACQQKDMEYAEQGALLMNVEGQHEKERARLDWALNNAAYYGIGVLTYIDESGKVENRCVPAGLVRQTIDEIMGVGK